MDHETLAYFAQREQSELAAATAAKTIEVRRVHEELAQRYATLKAGLNVDDIVAEERPNAWNQPAVRMIAGK